MHTDDNNPIITDILHGNTTEHVRKAELLAWAQKIQNAQTPKNVLRSFRVESILDERAKEQAKKQKMTYTRYLNLALQEFTEKFEELEAMQK